jgi:dUTP pyrophosphatase
MADNQNVQAPLTQEAVSEQNEIRLNKLRELTEAGKNPYEITRFDRTHLSDEILSSFETLENETVTIAPGERAKIPTGVAISPESRDVVAVLAGRSGHGLKNGVTLANGIGVIDSDYRGEISVVLINHGSEPFTVRRGDRIAQMMFMPVYTANFLAVDELDETERGAGGFGHTGSN